MKTKELLFSLFPLGLFLGSCSTSQKHVAFQSGGWKETIDPSTVRTHINKETNVDTEFQPTTKNTTFAVPTELNKKIESSNVAKIDENQIISPELISPNNTTIKTTKGKSEIKILNALQRIFHNPVQKKISTAVEKAQAINSGGSKKGYGMSIASLVLGILGILLSISLIGAILGPIFGLLAIIFGIIGIGREGKGMAIAGLIMGGITFIVSVTILIYLITTF